MANWCSNDIRFYVENAEDIPQLRKLYTVIYNAMYHPMAVCARLETDNDLSMYYVDKGWLGNVLIQISGGICPIEPTADGSIYDFRYHNNRIRFRGEIGDLMNGDITPSAFNDKQFMIWAETAWEPYGLIWKYVIEQLRIPAVQFSFFAEEEGMQLYSEYNTGEEAHYIDKCIPYSSGLAYDSERVYGSEQQVLDVINTDIQTMHDALTNAPDKFMIEQGIDVINNLVKQDSIENAEAMFDKYVNNRICAADNKYMEAFYTIWPYSHLTDDDLV